MPQAAVLVAERELEVSRLFVEVAVTLAPDFDLQGALDRLTAGCVRLLPVTGAAALVAAHNGTPAYVAGSDRRLRELSRLELDLADGPSIECYTQGEPVWCTELAASNGRWRRFVPAARSAGYLAVHALPMRNRGTTVGALVLFGRVPGEFELPAIRLGQALADVTTLGILQERSIRDQQVVVDQLQTALGSRVVIEQAKGILAERLSLSVSDAFALLRDHARRNRVKLAAVSRGVVDGSIHIPPSPW